jgi:prepilin-type N-terminal cleavage/methylation domain-containing protein
MSLDLSDIYPTVRLNHMRKNTSGFTIVELLIVIVIIGILATVTILAYNGVQQRARNQQTVAAVGSYTKALISYATENGTYPPFRSPLSCLGVGYTCDSLIDATANTAALLSDLSSYIKVAPQPATSARVGTGNRTGALYAGSVDTDRYILFIQENQSTCPQITGLSPRQAPELAGGNAICRSLLPTP